MVHRAPPTKPARTATPAVARVQVHSTAAAAAGSTRAPGTSDDDGARPSLDLITLGQRLRHLRKARGLTLDELGTAVGKAASQLSLIENGRREPRITLLQSIADTLGVPLAELLQSEAPSRRAGLEIALDRFQRDPLYQALGLPEVRPGRRLPIEALEVMVGLHTELRQKVSQRAATPQEARLANAELRQQMRERGNYYAHIDAAAGKVLAAVGHTTGPLSQRVILDIAAHLGFTLHHVSDLPRSTRSITDLRNRRIYLPQSENAGNHDPRTIVLQTLGHFVLGHADPTDYADFLRQRVEANYFAAALLIPETSAVPFLKRAKAERALAVEDLRDVYAVSYETAAHRFTNLATEHLGLPVHFTRVHESGIVYKAYENDGVQFPTDALGAIEGQLVCRRWASRTVFSSPDKFSTFGQYTDTALGTYWCASHVESTRSGEFSITVGVPYVHAKWFRMQETTAHTVSLCPDPTCCRRPPAELATRWEGNAWPAARAHSHLLAALPPGTFPGVDDTDVYTFLQEHAPQVG